MRTLYSIFSSRPNKMGHDITLPYCDIIQHIFIPTRSVARKTLLWTFSWASNSKFAIFLQLYPCNNYRAIKYPPVSIECGMEYPPVSQTLLIQGDNLSPCIIYRAFLNTGGSYCTMCTLCTALLTLPQLVLMSLNWILGRCSPYCAVNTSLKSMITWYLHALCFEVLWSQ